MTPQQAQAAGSHAAAAARAAAAFYRGWRSNQGAQPDPLLVEGQRQQAKGLQVVSAHRSRLSKLRFRFASGTTVAVAGTAVAAGTVTQGPLGTTALGVGAIAVGAWQALRGRKGLRDLQPPREVPQIMPAPAPLPAGCPGAESAMRVTQYRRTIMEMLPTIELLHPEAAEDIRAADAATAPGLNAMVERIRSMQRIQQEMPGTSAQASAQVATGALVVRLTEGAWAYHELLEAVITLAGAPALSGGPQSTLRPAIQDMRAYATGLQRAAETWR